MVLAGGNQEFGMAGENQELGMAGENQKFGMAGGNQQFGMAGGNQKSMAQKNDTMLWTFQICSHMAQHGMDALYDCGFMIELDTSAKQLAQ